MHTPQWKLVNEVRTAIRVSKTIPNGFFTSLTRRLQASLSSSSTAELQLIRDGVENILHDVVAKISKDVLTAAGGSELQTPISASYMLGQLSFAHQLIVSANGNAEPALNNEIFRTPKFAPYIAALKEDNLSGKQLADTCGLAPETVSRTLAVLREHGITDCRREGTSVVNFLTASGKIFADSIPNSSRADAALSEAKTDLLAHTPPRLMALPIFSVNLQRAA